MGNDNTDISRKQGSVGASKILTDRLYHFAAPILRQLMERLDRRLVKTFLICWLSSPSYVIETRGYC